MYKCFSFKYNYITSFRTAGVSPTFLPPCYIRSVILICSYHKTEIRSQTIQIQVSKVKKKRKKKTNKTKRAILPVKWHRVYAPSPLSPTSDKGNINGCSTGTNGLSVVFRWHRKMIRSKAGNRGKRGRR